MTFNPTQPRENDGRFGTVHRGDPGQLADLATGHEESAGAALRRLGIPADEVQVSEGGGQPRVNVAGFRGDRVGQNMTAAAIRAAARRDGLPEPQVTFGSQPVTAGE